MSVLVGFFFSKNQVFGGKIMRWLYVHCLPCWALVDSSVGSFLVLISARLGKPTLFFRLLVVIALTSLSTNLGWWMVWSVVFCSKTRGIAITCWTSLSSPSTCEIKDSTVKDCLFLCMFTSYEPLTTSAPDKMATFKQFARPFTWSANSALKWKFTAGLC